MEARSPPKAEGTIESADAISTQVVVTFDDLRKLWAERAEPKPILTVEDLIDRWGCSRDVILEDIDNPDHPIPCLSMGGPKSKMRKLLRLRVANIEAWEASMVRRAERTEEPAAAPKIGKPAGYTGKVYMTSTGKKAAKNAR